MVKKKMKKIKIKRAERKTPEKSTAPAVWNPFDIIDSMDRFFWDDPWMPGWRRRWGSLLPRSMWPEQWLEPGWRETTVDMVDTGREYKIIADMPGVSKNDLEVSITPNNISICGETRYETKKEDEGYVRHERSYSTLCKTMMFPEEVNPDKADATLKDGILEVKVSKKTPTAAKGRKIPVK